MAVEIVPAILARRQSEFQVRYQLARRYSRGLHIDVMDGRFVKTRSLSAERLLQLRPRERIELHLMVERPEEWMDLTIAWKARQVILPVELGAKLRTYIALFRSHSAKVSISINPRTPLAKLRPWVQVTKSVQVMTVDPGRYGAPFKPAMLNRIRQVRRRYPRVQITCDGGMVPATIRLARSAGADRFVVGSYLQRRATAETWKRLRAAASANVPRAAGGVV